MQTRLICIEKYMNKIIQGSSLEVLKKMPSEFVNMVITSPPYWALRDYGVERQLGLEPTFQEYINKLCDVFDEVKRVLKDTGTCWVNLGDTYGGHRGCLQRPGGETDYAKTAMGQQAFINGNLPGTKHKCLCMIPSRFAIEMTNRGRISRNEIIWHKPKCMPSSITDRFTVDFEKLFFFTKSKKYHFEQQHDPMSTSSINRLNQNAQVQNGSDRANGGEKTNGNMKAVGDLSKGRNKRCVWTISPKPFKEAHFAVYPPELIETPIKAGCPEGGIVLDPFMGSGTTALVALRLNRKFVGIELNPKYIEIAEKRIKPELEQRRLEV